MGNQSALDSASFQLLLVEGANGPRRHLPTLGSTLLVLGDILHLGADAERTARRSVPNFVEMKSLQR